MIKALAALALALLLGALFVGGKYILSRSNGAFYESAGNDLGVSNFAKNIFVRYEVGKSDQVVTRCDSAPINTKRPSGHLVDPRASRDGIRAGTGIVKIVRVNKRALARWRAEYVESETHSRRRALPEVLNSPRNLHPDIRPVRKRSFFNLQGIYGERWVGLHLDFRDPLGSIVTNNGIDQRNSGNDGADNREPYLNPCRYFLPLSGWSSRGAGQFQRAELLLFLGVLGAALGLPEPTLVTRNRLVQAQRVRSNRF